MLFIRIQRFFVRHAFMLKTAVYELYFAKKFCSENYNKIFFVFMLHCKKMLIFSIRPIKESLCLCCFAKPTIIVFGFAKKWKQSCLCSQKNVHKQKIFVFVVQR